MKEQISILLAVIILGLFGFSTSSYAATTEDPLSIETKDTPSETYLSKNKRSIGARTDVQTISAPSRGLNRLVDKNDLGWGDPFLPGGDGWDISETGNVGYPIGDVSLPILLSMLIIYFIYRGVSSTKRRNNF